MTNDVSRLAAFYKEIFCMRSAGDEVHSAFDDMQLAIWNPGDINISITKNMSLMYFVDDAEYEYERLSLIEGIEGISKPVIQPWGVKAFSFKDPDGNEVSFLEQLNKPDNKHSDNKHNDRH